MSHFATHTVDPRLRITIPGLDAAPARVATFANVRPSLGLYKKMRFGKWTVP
jgi:hypothetical protein